MGLILPEHYDPRLSVRETQEAIKTQETQVEEESASIGNLLTEKSSKQQEVQNLAGSHTPPPSFARPCNDRKKRSTLSFRL